LRLSIGTHAHPALLVHEQEQAGQHQQHQHRERGVPAERRHDVPIQQAHWAKIHRCATRRPSQAADATHTMVQFDTSDQRLAALVTDCLAVGLFEDDGLTDAAQTIDAAAGGLLRKLKGAGDLPARAGETQMLLAPAGIKARRLLVVGLGKRADFRERGWRRAVSAALGACLKTRSARLALAIDPPQTDPVDAYYRGRAIADLTGAALYRVNDFKTARKPPRPALQRVT